jgi:2-polyprenyl-3-methyl-5-hydroxy-6-metoxy-1,4-benzoquinol methylase
VALDVARRLSKETGLKADFVQGTVDEASHLTPGPFDLVFTTWGTICWLPDITVWARVIASVLEPGGELYFADAHPSFLRSASISRLLWAATAFPPGSVQPGSHMTPRWSKADSNSESHPRATPPAATRFVADSALEGDGFEPSVPVREN